MILVDHHSMENNQSNQDPINLRSIVEAAFNNCIYIQAWGDSDPNCVAILGKEEFLAQITRDLQKSGINIREVK